jgi:hypothetical protein
MKEVRVILTIAHLDHDETNWKVSDDRLKAMCQKCHLDYDAVEKYHRIIKKALGDEPGTGDELEGEPLLR